MKKILLTIFAVTAFAFTTKAQDVNGVVVVAKVNEGDTLPVVYLKEVPIYSFEFKNKREARQHEKLMRNVKKVYPFARLAGIKLQEYNSILEKAANERERRRIMKKAEDEIEAEFGDDLRKLTFSQGKILIKLIDRETGSSSFELVQDLRGKFTAFFYQTFARIFGYNLKVSYDPTGEDKDIEAIVRMIETGQI